MSQITYNGVCLPYPSFTEFQQIAKRDGESDTDPVGIEYRIGVQCLITAAYIPLLLPDLAQGLFLSTNSPADIMVIVRNRLSQPRKQLSVQFNGVELIPTKQRIVASSVGPDNIDAMNGPKPGACIIMNLTNNSFLLKWSITAHYLENLVIDPTQGATLRYNFEGSPILFNRWTEELHINNLNLCRRTRRGKFMIRSDNTLKLVADRFTNQFAVLGVPPGWLRESSKYTEDPGGLAISYEVIDKQQYKMPPEPAYEAEGDFTESTTTEGAKLYGDCRVLLRGSGVSPVNPEGLGQRGGAVPSRDPQAVLCNLAIATAMRKIQVCLAGADYAAAIGSKPNQLILQSASLRLSLWKCEVEFNCRVLAARQDKLKDLIPFSFISTEVYNQSRVYTPFYPVHGSAGFLIQAAAYYDPALGANWDPATGQWVGGVEPGTGYGGAT